MAKDSENSSKVIDDVDSLFFSHSFDFLAIVGSDGYFKKINPSFRDALGYTDQELYDRPLLEFLHPEDVRKTNSGIQTLASGTPRIASLNRYRRKDGTYRWISWNSIPKGALIYTIGRDITEQIKAEEKIQELNLELEKRNQDLEKKVEQRITELRSSEAQVQQLQKMDAIGRLAGGIAHDFNNILGAISMYCDLLAFNFEDPKAVSEQVQDIKQATERAAALTRQLLIFGRRQVLQKQTISLNPIIQQMEKMLARLIGENITIKMKLADELKPVNIDPSQMEQIVLNLVVNAKDAMPSGGTIILETSNLYLNEKITGTHLSVNKGHYVLFTVSDTGLGMDATTVTKIFEPFFTTKAIGKGTGLGLSTVYGIIKQSNGAIWVSSEPSKGTVFKICIPIAEHTVEEPKATPTTPVLPTETQTILLTEDDERLRSGFSIMLRKRGYQVLLARDGEEALEVYKNHGTPIHLLLTDVVMPGMSGFDLARKIQALQKDIRILYMSGYTSDALEKSGMEDTTNIEFIQKPFDTQALIKKIQSALKAATYLVSSLP